MSLAALRGFRDYPPPDAGARSELRRRMRASARRCGFVELEAPSVESLELYRVKSGAEIGEQLWAFKDKGGRDVALSAETTPSLARIYVDRAKSEPMPAKWFTLSRLWRYEEPQAGRSREFLQFNLDILGVSGVQAEAELLAAASLVLDEVGAKDLYAFRVNDRHLAEGLGLHFGATSPGAFFHTLDRYRKLSPADFRTQLSAAGLPDDGIEGVCEFLAKSGTGVPSAQADAFLESVAAFSLPEPALAAVERLRTLFRLCGSAGIGERVVFDPSVVRGLAYYTSTVFEAYDREGDLRSLFGGGRYDGLIELFGGPPTPALGLAIGDQTLEILLRGHGRWPEGETGIDTYVIAVTPELVPEALAWVQKLRRAGRSADADLMGRSLSRQFREAARRKARRALILGPQEKARGVLVERDLSSGAQRELTPDEVLGPA